MKQIIDTWTALGTQRKILAGLAGAGILAAVFMLGRMAMQPSMSLLYAGLENGQAGEIVRVLEQRGVAYEIRNDSIFVQGAARDELRLTLASEGLPANSNQGYELLDSLNGFGTTSQMFDAAYWRAKEGELARTVLANPTISSARVHIANADDNPFRRNTGATASVFVTTVNGGLSGQQGKALKFLVASAVPGLVPDDVAVIDSIGGLISGAEDNAAPNANEDKSLALKDRVTRLIEARVGHGNAVVEVSVETVTESESIRERVLDPNSRIAISTDTEERSNTAKEAGGGDVTVASNLPNGDGAGGSESNTENSETRERINYEISETEREITRGPGAIKRLTVAVLVNGSVETTPEGTESFVPLPDTELDSLRELVSSAVGFEEARGDVITIKSMAFEPIAEMGTAAAGSGWNRFALDPLSLIQMGVLALVTLILGLFVVRPIMTKAPPNQVLALPPDAPNAYEPAPFEQPMSRRALDGEIDDGTGEFSPIMASEISGPSAGLLDQEPQAPEDPVTRLRGMIGDRREETVEILRGWLDETEEKA